VALRDTGPIPVLRYATHQDNVLSANKSATGRGTSPSPLKVGGSRPPQRSSSLTDFLGLATMAEDWQSPGLTGQITITSQEPRVMAINDGRPISLLIDTGTTFSAFQSSGDLPSLLQPP
jgi:hypothetical protein